VAVIFVPTFYFFSRSELHNFSRTTQKKISEKIKSTRDMKCILKNLLFSICCLLAQFIKSVLQQFSDAMQQTNNSHKKIKIFI
jgi:hypothetical protein